MENFQITHSKIIEQYQLIEHHLEGLFAKLEDGGTFEQLAHRVENDTMGELIRKVRFLVKENNIKELNKDDFSILDRIRDDRNFWCHNCYLDIHKDSSMIAVLSIRLKKDLVVAQDMNNKLRSVFKKI